MFPIFNNLLDHFSCDLAIDLGSTNTLIYRKGKGIVLDEPSVIAFQPGDRNETEVLQFGSGAKALLKLGSRNLKLVQPVKYGVVADTRAAQAMLDSFLGRIRRKWLPASMRVLANVPAEASEENKKSFLGVIRSAGACEVYLMEEPRALALGAGLDISEDHATMVLDIGGGITEMAVIVAGKAVHMRTLRIGGEHMDQAIVDYLKKTRNFLIDIHTAETAKVQIGEVCPGAAEKSFLTEGVNIATGLPRFVEVSSDDVREALSRPLRIIIDTINDFLNSLPSALYVDILDRGITLAGGGSLLRGIDRLLERNILMPVLKSKDPLACLVLGTGSALPYLKEYRQAQGAKGLSLPAPPVIKR